MCSSRDKIIQTVETNFELQPFKDEAVRVIDLSKFPGDFDSPNGAFNYINPLFDKYNFMYGSRFHATC